MNSNKRDMQKKFPEREVDGEPESIEVMVVLHDEHFKGYYDYDEHKWYVDYGGITVGHRRIEDSEDIEDWYAIPLPTPAPVADNPDHIFNPVSELPKEADGKAKELVEKFIEHAHSNWDDYHGYDEQERVYNAKQCALISNQREIDLINRLLTTGLNNDFDLLRERGELMDVRTAINQL